MIRKKHNLGSVKTNLVISRRGLIEKPGDLLPMGR